MKIGQILKTRARGISCEFFPPSSEEARSSFVAMAKEFESFDPLYASVSYGAGGTTRDRTFMALEWLKIETKLALMSHLTCIGTTKDSIEVLLRRLQQLGVDNVLALRGDPPKNVPYTELAKGQFPHAVDLVKFIKKYGTFSIGVAVYPEGHRLSSSIDEDMDYTKKKIDAGADFAITQMFFDNRYYYDFLERASRQGISIPILPGIMPIVDCRKMVQFAARCNTRIPQEILDRMEPAIDMPEDMRKLGVEFAIRQALDLISNGVRYLHFYSMNRADSLHEILDALGSKRKKA